MIYRIRPLKWKKIEAGLYKTTNPAFPSTIMAWGKVWRCTNMGLTYTFTYLSEAKAYVENNYRNVVERCLIKLPKKTASG